MLVQRKTGSLPAFTKGHVGTSEPSPFLGRRKAVIGLTSMAISALAAPHVARAAIRRVRFGHNSAPDSLFGLGGEEFANAVAADPVLEACSRSMCLGMRNWAMT